MENLTGRQLGQYEILDVLGQGGMATVYRARQLAVQREVAVKVMTLGSDYADDSTFVARFQREAQTVASLSHPNILKVFDYGFDQNILFLVMELMPGGSLSKLIGRGKLPPKLASRILNQIASALDYAHQKGIVHRDLKPQNVLLDANGNAFLTDFGIAKVVQAATALTQSGTAMGTPLYMSPEQWRGENVDARSDTYSLGIMLYEMLAGQVPFEGTEPYSLMYKHINEPPPPLPATDAFPSQSVNAVIDKALAKDSDQRYAQASVLAADFRDALMGRKVDAASTIAFPVKQNKPLARIAAFAALAVLIALLAAGYARLRSSAAPLVPSSTAIAVNASVLTPGTWSNGTFIPAVTETSAATYTPQPPPTSAPQVVIVTATIDPNAVPSPTLDFGNQSSPAPTFALETLSSGNPQIVYAVAQGTRREIFVADSTGRNSRQITFDGVINYAPAWSPDHKQVVFSSTRSNGSQIYVMDLQSRVEHQLSRPSESSYNANPRFSPDGKFIAYTSQSNGHLVIDLLNLQTSKVYTLTPSSTDSQAPAWSPDSRQIAFVSGARSNPQLSVMDSDGAHYRIIASNLFGAEWPSWSPDSSNIAFAVVNKNNSSTIYLVRSSGDVPRPLLTFAGQGGDTTWSPDSRYLLFSVTKDGQTSIMIVNADGQNPHFLIAGMTPNWWPG